MTWKSVACLGVLLIGLSLIPASALAQNTGIAGVVKDASGGVLPGVTVEAQSPALIERVRNVITDAQGLYSIVDLRPGTYVVTFTLPGFSTVRREGIELKASFTATVNAELAVGTVEETLTVTGEAPIVDTRNVVQSRVLTDDLRESLPNGRTIVFMALSIPGLSNTTSGATSGQDVVGTSDSRGASMIHGSRSADSRTELDGATLNNTATQSNPGEAQEYVYEVGGISAETSQGGVRRNIIPKEGGNRFTGEVFFAGSTGGLQSSNLTQKLIDLGIPTPNKMNYNRDINISSGGPITRDKVWFFGSFRHFEQNDQLVGMYFTIDPKSFVFDPAQGAAGNVDLSKPAYNIGRNFFYNGRVTWQATPKNKFGAYFSWQPRKSIGQGASGTRSMEASRQQNWYRNQVVQGSWKAPLTSRLLIEANGTDSYMAGHLVVWPGQEDVVSVVDSGTGYTFRSSSTDLSDTTHHTGVARVAVSYVTGSHTSKFGFVSEWGANPDVNGHVNQNMTFSFRNGLPTGITVFNTPDTNDPHFHRMGLFAQDQWTLKRVTLNAGLRLDTNVERIGSAQVSGPNAYAPVTRWPEMDNVPNWKDISPRLGAAYDLFGSGKTAVKMTLGRYVVDDAQSYALSVDPISFNRSATRSWDDRRACAGGILGDFVPQECELGTLSNSAFGTAATTTRTDDGLRQGWGIRQNNWEAAVSVQHQLLPRVGLNVAYTRRWFNNFTVTDNKALQPTDYDEFCITAPTDDRLGSISGTQVCGLYDLNPAKRSVTPDNLRTDAKNYGTQEETYQGIDVIADVRLPARATLSGGLNFGPAGGNNAKACFVIDSPGALRFCDVRRDWKADVRFVGSFDLPFGINTGVSFTSLPGPQILANYSVANAQITSGLVQFKNPARTTFGSGSASVALLAPGTQFNERLYQVDLRLSKAIRYRALRGRVMLDIGNLTNASMVTVQSNAYGTNWLRPSNIFPGRVLKPGFQLEF